jgi:hypothetical protein
MPRAELLENWQKLLGAEPPAHISRDLLARAIAHKIQEKEYGGLDKSTRRRLRALARTLETEGSLPTTSGPILKPGAKLVREWHGRTYRVVVLEEGFEFEGRRYRSLSKIAREITGAHWSGQRFFGLLQNERSPSNGKAP